MDANSIGGQTGTDVVNDHSFAGETGTNDAATDTTTTPPMDASNVCQWADMTYGHVVSPCPDGHNAVCYYCGNSPCNEANGILTNCIANNFNCVLTCPTN
jgi:hypothetical protein